MAGDGLEQRHVLRAQAQEMLEQLNHIEAALAHAALEAHLLDRVAVRFKSLVQQRRSEVLRLRNDVDGGGSIRQGWAELHEIRAAAAPLFAECLALVEGGLVRAVGLDQGLCRVADVLLTELARLSECPWDRFTVLAEGEYFNSVAEIIRLRFPEVSIWSLPVAAHEFGHYVAQSLAGSPDAVRSTPFASARSQGPSAAIYAHERFADCFATYALGPAYPCMCVLQRLDPWTANDATPSHPDSASRVWLCLDILQRMDRDAGLLSPFANVLMALRNAWAGIVTDATGQPPSLDPATEAALGTVSDAYWDILEHAMPNVRYREWLRALGIAQTLGAAHEQGAASNATAIDVRDALNAAWAARLVGSPGIVAGLADWGVQTCARLAPGGNP